MRFAGARQLAFAFLPAGEGEESFVPGDANMQVMQWLEAGPGVWGAPGLVMVGPAMSGKSTLLRFWASGQDAAWFAGESAPEGRHLVVDDVQRWAGDLEAEEALFHAFNRVEAEGRLMVLASRVAPAALDWELPDLASRLKRLPVAQIGLPDDQMLAGLIETRFRHWQMEMDAAVLDYLLPRMERDYASVFAVVDGVVRASLAAKRGVTVPLVRECMAA